ncbi:MAG: hypothetical protein PHQ23_03420 [Candidatus Wallbacteria bacterium]|nr:hypothetical protein [Candidatus Wallbacteria bacterium]
MLKKGLLLMMLPLLAGLILFGCLGGGSSSESTAGSGFVFGSITGASASSSFFAPQLVTGSAFASATVTLYNPTYSQTTTAVDGEIYFDQVEAANYVMIVLSPGAEPLYFPVSVALGERVTFNLHYNPSGALEHQLLLTLCRAVYGSTTGTKITKYMKKAASLSEVVDENFQYRTGFDLTSPTTTAALTGLTATSDSTLFDSLIANTPGDVSATGKDVAKAVLAKTSIADFYKPTVMITEYYNQLSPATQTFDNNSTIYAKVSARAYAGTNPKLGGLKVALVDKATGSAEVQTYPATYPTVTADTIEITQIFSFSSRNPGNYIIVATAIDTAQTSTPPVVSIRNTATTFQDIVVRPVTTGAAYLTATITPGNLTKTFELNVGTLAADPSVPSITAVTDTANSASIEKGDKVRLTASFGGQSATVDFSQSLEVFNDGPFTLTVTAKYYYGNAMMAKSGSTTFSYSGSLTLPATFVTVFNQEGVTSGFELGDTMYATVEAMVASVASLNQGKFKLCVWTAGLLQPLTIEVEDTGVHDWAVAKKYNLLVSGVTPFTATGTYQIAAKVGLNSGLVKFFTKEVIVSTYPPQVATLNSTTPMHVVVTFDQQVTTTEAETTANYTITGLTITAATLLADRKTVRLTTGMQQEISYPLTIQNLKDLNGNVMSAYTGSFTGTAGIGVASATATSNTKVRVVYTLEPVQADAETPANYAITGGAGLTVGAAAKVDSVTYDLTTTSQTSQSYTLQVSNVRDTLTTTAITTAAGQATFTGDKLPVVSSIAVSPAEVTSGSNKYLKNSSYSFVITFDEAMKTTVTPTVTLAKLGTTLDATETWPSSTQCQAVVDLTGEVDAGTAWTLSISAAQDAAGNAMVANTSYTYEVDTVAPNAPALSAPYNSLTYQTKEVSHTISGTKTANTDIWVKKGTAAWAMATGVTQSATTWSYATGTLSEGSTEVLFKTADIAGNLSAPATVEIKVDNTAPVWSEADIVAFTSGYYTAMTSFRYPTSDISKVYIHVKNTTVPPTSATDAGSLKHTFNATAGQYQPCKITGLNANTTYSIFVFAADALGNYSMAQRKDILTLNDSAPPAPGTRTLTGAVTISTLSAAVGTEVSVFDSTFTTLLSSAATEVSGIYTNVLASSTTTTTVRVFINGIENTSADVTPIPYPEDGGFSTINIGVAKTGGINALQAVAY